MPYFDDLLTGLTDEPASRQNRFEDLVPSPRRVVNPRRRAPFREPERETVDEDAPARRAAVGRLSGAPRPIASSVVPSRVPTMAPRDVTATEADRRGPGLRQSLRNQNPTVGDYLAQMTLGMATEHPIETAAWTAAAVVAPEIALPLRALEVGYAGRGAAKAGMYATKPVNRAMGNEDFAPSERFDVSGPEAAMEGAFGLILGKGAARGVRAAERTAAESSAGFEDALFEAEKRSAPYRWAKQQNVAEVRPNRLLAERSESFPSTSGERQGPGLAMPEASFVSRDTPEVRPERLLNAPYEPRPTAGDAPFGPAIPSRAVAPDIEGMFGVVPPERRLARGPLVTPAPVDKAAEASRWAVGQRAKRAAAGESTFDMEDFVARRRGEPTAEEVERAALRGDPIEAPVTAATVPKNAEGYFEDARTGGGVYRKLERVSNDGLMRQLAEYADERLGTQSYTPAAKAMVKRLDAIEAELEKRGLTQEQIWGPELEKVRQAKAGRKAADQQVADSYMGPDEDTSFDFGARAGATRPAVVSTLGGAAAGAAGGGMVGDTPEERRRNALLGAVAGGAGSWMVGRRMEGSRPGGPPRPRVGAFGDLKREGPWTAAHQLEMGKVRAAETAPKEAPDLLPAMERERVPEVRGNRTGAVGDVAKVGGSGSPLGKNRAPEVEIDPIKVQIEQLVADTIKDAKSGDDWRFVFANRLSDDFARDNSISTEVADLAAKRLAGIHGHPAMESGEIVNKYLDGVPDEAVSASRVGFMAPEVAGGVGGAGIGAFAGSTQGDTPEERKRNMVAGAVAGAVGGTAAFLRGPATALRRGATAVGVGTGGALLSQSDDEKIKATGVGLMGLATVHAIGLPRFKAAGKAAGGVAVEALKTTETGRKVLDLISHDILADPQVKSLIGAYQEGVAFGKARAAELSKESAALGPSADRKVSDIIEKEAFEPTPLGTDQTIALAVAQRVSDEFTALGRAKVDAGLLASETVSKREGKYLPRMYAGPLAETATGAAPRVTVGGRKPRIVGDKMRDESLTPVVRTQLGEVREASFRTAVGLEKGYKDVAAAKLFEGLSEIPGVIHPDYKAATDGWFTARQMVGEDAVWRTAVRDARKEMDALSKQFKDGTDGYVKLPDTPGLGVLRGAVVRKDVAEYLTDIPGVSAPAGKAMSLLKTWKRIHTVLNPGTHVGNTVSNSVIAHMSGVPIWAQAPAIRAALKDFKNYGESTRYLAEKGILDRGLPTAGDAVPSAGQQMKPALEELARTTRPATARVLAEGGITPLSPIRRGLRKANVGAERLYSKEDGVFRVMVFDRLVKNGMEKEAAAKYVDEAFVNYETRSPLLGAIKNTISPFIMYPVKAIPFVAGQIVEHPLRWMSLSAAWGAMDQYSQNKVGEMAQGDLRPAQRTNKSLGYLEPGSIQLPMVNARGDKYMTDIGRWTPFSAITGSPMPGSVTSNLSDRLPGIVQPTGPLVEIGARAFNTDPFTGDKWIKPGDDARDKVGKVIGAGANMAMPSALSFHVPRVASDIRNADPKAAAVDALGLIGARPSVVRPGMQGTREARQFEEARRNILADLRYALRANKDPQREATLKARAQRKIEALAKEYQTGQARATP